MPGIRHLNMHCLHVKKLRHPKLPHTTYDMRQYRRTQIFAPGSSSRVRAFMTTNAQTACLKSFVFAPSPKDIETMATCLVSRRQHNSSLVGTWVCHILSTTVIGWDADAGMAMRTASAASFSASPYCPRRFVELVLVDRPALLLSLHAIPSRALLLVDLGVLLERPCLLQAIVAYYLIWRFVSDSTPSPTITPKQPQESLGSFPPTLEAFAP